MLIDIVILPPKSFRKKFGKLGLNLKHRFPAFYAVDNKNLIPHLSLFHIRTNKVERVTKALPGRLADYKSFAIYPTRFTFHNIGNSYLIGGLEIKNTRALQVLHEAAVHGLHKFKSGAAFKPQKFYSQKQRYYRTRYGGNPHMLEFYGPHLTLARLKILNPRQKSDLNKLLKVKFGAFKADVVAVAETDKNHQVIKILKQFKLK